ncbi:MAG: hypothetical protein KJ941_12070 [Bacteroidetes bacterium]|nr:hypothetical protein [Bacteroidota bacterium]
MRKNFLILCVSFISMSLWAQAPEKMSFQAVIRNSSNALVNNSSVGMRISILKGSALGTAEYVETQSPTTNANGLASLEIGTGTVVTGNFSAIDWTNDEYFIKTETDPSGGTNYTISGTTQLLSVPYAMHAKTAESISGTLNETDPDFNASVASGINANDILNWNAKLDTEVDGSTSNEIQNLSIVNDSLMISSANKIGLSQLNYWEKTANNGLKFGTEKVGKDLSNLNIGFESTKTASGNNELQGVYTLMQSNAGNTSYMIGSKNIAKGQGTGIHIGVLGAGGEDNYYVLTNNARYGVHGMSTDINLGIASNVGMYGFAAGNQNGNYGVDGTAGSTVGDNFGNSGWAWGATPGVNYGLYGYATASTAANYAVYGIIETGTTSPIKYSGYFKGAPVGIENDNIYIKDFSKGVILTSPNGTCYQVKVNDAGTLVTTAVTCPN